MTKFTFKLVLLGDQAVGKTSLVLRYVNNSFSEHYISTIGADFLIKDLELFGAPVRLMIWDLGGQQQWEAIRARYMQGSDGCILIYDVSRKTDIEYYFHKWKKEVEDFIGPTTPLIFVGNKIDLNPQVNLKKAAKIASDNSTHYIETSAKTGDRVESMFQRLTADIVKQKAEYIRRMKGIQDSDISSIFNQIREKE